MPAGFIIEVIELSGTYGILRENPDKSISMRRYVRIIKEICLGREFALILIV